MSPAPSSTLYLKAATVTDTVFTIPSTQTFNVDTTTAKNITVSGNLIIPAPSGDTSAVNKAYITEQIGYITNTINTLKGGETMDLHGFLTAITDVSGNLSNEVTRAKGVEHDISGCLYGEIRNRSDAVDTLNSRVDTETADRENADKALAATINDVSILPVSAVITADGAVPIPLTQTQILSGYQGWRYKNSVDNKTYAGIAPSERKINWYFINNFPTSPIHFEMKVSDIKEICVPMMFIGTKTPIITIYTKTKASGNAGGWYFAKKTWRYDGPTVVPGKKYLLRFSPNDLSLTAKYEDYTNLDLVYDPLDTMSSSGDLLANDDVLSISFGTDSSIPANLFDFAVINFEIRTSKGNKKMLLSNDSVLNGYLLNTFEKMINKLYQGTSILPDSTTFPSF